MYKNILIVTDNIEICRRFYHLIQELNLVGDIKWDVGVSKFSDIVKFKNELVTPVRILNLIDSDLINEICTKYDLVFSLHSKQIFPAKLVNGIKCINVHPGYNPLNRGWYPQVFAIINKSRVGATIHEIDEKLDHGKIIDREFVNIFSWDTSLTLYNRILEMEMELLKRNLQRILTNNYESFLPEEEGTLYLKKDFNDLLELDLNHKQTIGETIDLLRALTHGNFKNAYFIDRDTNRKIFVNLELVPN